MKQAEGKLPFPLFFHDETLNGSDIILSVSEVDFLRMAEEIQECTEERTRFELKPWMNNSLKDMDSYCELTLEKSETCEPVSSYVQVFQDHKGRKGASKRILIKGNPGMGKTTLVKKITSDWVEGEMEVLRRFDVLFFLSLKEAEKGLSIEEAICRDNDFLEGLDISAENVRSILEGFGPRCLLILDGLDEYLLDPEKQPLGNNFDVGKVLTGRRLRRCNIILTTRPHCINDDIKKKFQTVVKVNGFSEAEAAKFAEKVLLNKSKIPDVINFSRLKEGEVEDFALHRNPILLSILCCLADDNKIDLKASPDQYVYSEIYAMMVMYMYAKYMQQQGKTFYTEKREHLLASLAETLMLVGSLAWDTLKSGNPHFLESEVRREVGDGAFALGLLSGDHEIRSSHPCVDTAIAWPHKTIQEFYGSFFYVLMVHEGLRGKLIGREDEPKFMQTGLFGHFCNWLAEKSEDYFPCLKGTRLPGRPLAQAEFQGPVPSMERDDEYEFVAEGSDRPEPALTDLHLIECSEDITSAGVLQKLGTHLGVPHSRIQAGLYDNRLLTDAAYEALHQWRRTDTKAYTELRGALMRAGQRFWIEIISSCI